MDLLNKTIAGGDGELNVASCHLNTFVPEENLIPSISVDVEELCPLPRCPDDLDTKLKMIQKQLLIDTVKIFNRKVQDFYYGDDLYDKLRSLVGDWLTDMNSSTQHDSSQLNASMLEKSICHTNKESLESRLTSAENQLNLVSDKVKTLTELLDQKQSRLDKQEEEIVKCHLENTVLTAHCNQLQEEAEKKHCS